MNGNASSMTPQEAADLAVSSLGCGYDLTYDLRLSACKRSATASRLVRLDEGGAGDLVLPCGVVVRDVPRAVRCDKGDRTRFRSDVLSFHRMAEQFNQDVCLSGKVPSGLFNAMFDFRAGWQKDASATKNLSFDGWFITLYSIELEKSHIALHDHVKQDVPSSWDPAALAKFIEQYGTHIVVGLKMGAKDAIYIKQQYESTLSPKEVQDLLKCWADKCFSEDSDGKSEKNNQSAARQFFPVQKPIRLPTILNDDIVYIHVRRGGIDKNQSHSNWLSTISMSPDVVSMSFVPISSLLSGVRGSGFLSHAINLYLRYRPPIEELHHFLEFQLPKRWAPAFGDLPLCLQRRRNGFPSLQFILMGPKLSINTIPVESGHRPVTGIRLYLEGKKNNCLAVHLQHLSDLPGLLQLPGDTSHDDVSLHHLQSTDYHEPVRWAFLSLVCTAPVQHAAYQSDGCAYMVTKAWLEVREISLRKVLFLRLGFSAVASARIRNSQWSRSGPAGMARKSGSISVRIGAGSGGGLNPPPEPPGAKVDLNSGVYANGPPAPAKEPRMSSVVDMTETVRGPEVSPGYWVVTGAKLCVEGGKISLRAKYSLLTLLGEDDT